MRLDPRLVRRALAYAMLGSTAYGVFFAVVVLAEGAGMVLAALAFVGVAAFGLAVVALDEARR